MDLSMTDLLRSESTCPCLYCLIVQSRLNQAIAAATGSAAPRPADPDAEPGKPRVQYASATGWPR